MNAQMGRKIAKAAGFTVILALWWTYLVSHYYDVLSDWAAKKLWRTQPFMYASIEWWLLVSLIVCTCLAVKIIETLGA